MKHLSRKAKIALIIGAVVLLSGAGTGTFFGVRKHKASKKTTTKTTK